MSSLHVIELDEHASTLEHFNVRGENGRRFFDCWWHHGHVDSLGPSILSSLLVQLLRLAIDGLDFASLVITIIATAAFALLRLRRLCRHLCTSHICCEVFVSSDCLF